VTSYKNLFYNYRVLQRNSTADKFTHRIYLQLERNLQKIEQLISKITYKRIKRGLMNFLGTGIKFVTGNLDDNDLKTINENLDALHKSKSSEIDKINKLTSFANHLSKRYSDDLELLNKNILSTQKFFRNLTTTEEIRIILQNEVFHSEMLLDTLTMLERTISLAFNGIPNLEIITVNETIEIQNYLEKNYEHQQLSPIDHVHLFKVLEFAKISIIGTDQAITFLLKIPIFQNIVANSSRIYPIPNHQDIAMLPPKKFLVKMENENRWTNEECRNSSNAISYCYQKTFVEDCNLKTFQHCRTAKIENKYKIIHVLKNRELLILFQEPQEILEDYQGKLTRKSVKGANLLTSPCKIIIGTSFYDNTIPVFEIATQNISEIDLKYETRIDLHLRHLDFPTEIIKEAKALNEQPLYLQPVSQVFHYSLSVFIACCMIIILTIIIRHRKRVIELLYNPRQIIHVSKDSKPTLEIKLNEDVQN